MKAICIDDEQLALDYLERQLSKVKDIEVIGKDLHPLEGKQHVMKADIDVVFLDIQMPEIHGIELAEQLLELNPKIHVVFVTAYSEYAPRAFELNAIDYLVKPVKIDRLRQTIERLEKQMLLEKAVIPAADTMNVQVANYLMFETEKDVYQPLNWRTAKTQELFLYLVQNHGKVLEKTTLIELLWDASDVEKSFSRLYTTVYNMRKALRAFGNHFILHNQTDGYLLELKDVKVDLFEWEKEVLNLPPLSESTIDRYISVINENKGPYLLNHDYLWAEGERHHYEKKWQRIAHHIANYYQSQNQLELALLWYKQISVRHPDNEEAHFSLMKLYAQTGKSSAVFMQYDYLHQVMRNKLGLEPSNYIEEWFKHYQNSH